MSPQSNSHEDSQLRIVEGLSDIQINDLFDLIRQQWWGVKRSREEVEVMVANTNLMIGMIDESERLVGYCRALTDFVFRATIYDVMVERNWQGQGVGKRLLDSLCRHPKLVDVNLIYLACEPELFPFYQRHGFKVYDGRANWMVRIQHAEE